MRINRFQLSSKETFTFRNKNSNQNKYLRSQYRNTYFSKVVNNPVIKNGFFIIMLNKDRIRKYIR